MSTCTSAIYCEHANECPSSCPCNCPKTCYCYVEGNCGKRASRIEQSISQSTVKSTSVEMTRDDVMRETLNHVRRVGNLLLEMATELMHRANIHDDSKFSPEEFESFAQETPTLRGLTYGSEEYKAALLRIKPALQFHYSRNDHHPEHFPNGVYDMDLLQLIEMLADWKAATERHANGSLSKSIVGNAARFGYDDRFAKMLGMTALNIGWMTEAEYQTIHVSNEPASTERKKCCGGKCKSH